MTAGDTPGRGAGVRAERLLLGVLLVPDPGPVACRLGVGWYSAASLSETLQAQQRRVHSARLCALRTETARFYS